jgi:hypothetical protein
LYLSLWLCSPRHALSPNHQQTPFSASLTSFLKKDNPDAKLEEIKLLDSGSSGTLISTSFGYKDFTYASKKGEKKTESGTGTAMFDNISGKWVLDTVTINYGTPDAEIWSPKTEVK